MAADGGPHDAGEHEAKHQFVQRPDRIPVGQAADAPRIEDGRLVDRDIPIAGHHLEFQPAASWHLHLGRQPQPPRPIADVDLPAIERLARLDGRAVRRIVYDADTIRILLQVFGTTQVLAGTDYPFAIMDREPAHRIDQLTLDDATRRLLRQDNALRWLGRDSA